MSTPTKRCSKCKFDKPATPESFFREKKNKDGLSYACKVCKQADQTAWRANNPDAALAKDRRFRELHREKRNAAARAKRAADPDACNAYYRARYAANPEAARAYQREWQKANPEKFAEHQKRTRSKPENRARHVARAKRWNKTNRDRYNKNQLRVQALRNQKKAASGYVFNRIEREKLFAAQSGQCFYCKTPLQPGHHTDHKTPLARGGQHIPENLVLSCPPCNRAKATMTYEEFIKKTA